MKTKEIWLIVRDGYNDQIVLVKDYDSKDPRSLIR